MPRKVVFAVITAVFALALAPAAFAEKLCVNMPGATPDCQATYAVGQLGQALLDAAAPGPTDVVIGPGTYTGPFSYNDTDEVHIVGSGVVQTLLQGAADSSNVVKLGSNAASSITHLTIQAQASNLPVMLRLLAGTADDVHTSFDNATQNSTGVMLLGGTLRHSTVTAQALGVQMGDALALEDTVVSANIALEYKSFGPPSRVSRVRLDATHTGVDALTGTVNLTDSVVHVTGPGTDALRTAAGSGDAAIHADRVTVVGSGAANQVGMRAVNAQPNSNVAITLDNSILSGFTIAVWRHADPGAANVNISYSHVERSGADHDDPPVNGGTGAITESNPVAGGPGFVDATSGDYHLLPSSPLLDAGDPADATAGAFDLDGNPRPDDADGDCVRRVDLGAYEVQRLVPKPTATATALPVPGPTGASAAPNAYRFDGSASCDPEPGDTLAYAWAFDDGASATGPTADHSFTTAGQHVATLTVTDPAAHAATASVTVAVPPALIVTPPTDPAPILSALKASPRRFHLARGARAKRGTRLTFKLSEPATVRLTAERRAGKRWRKIKGSAKPTGRKGRNTWRFNGRLSKRLLPNGTYRLTLVATDSAGHRSKPRRVTVTILR